MVPTMQPSSNPSQSCKISSLVGLDFRLGELVRSMGLEVAAFTSVTGKGIWSTTNDMMAEISCIIGAPIEQHSVDNQRTSNSPSEHAKIEPSWDVARHDWSHFSLHDLSSPRVFLIYHLLWINWHLHIIIKKHERALIRDRGEVTKPNH